MHDMETIREAGLLLRDDLELKPPDVAEAEDAYMQMRDFIAQKVAHWMQNAPEHLFNVLYRLDVSENKAKAAFTNQTEEEPAIALANLIMEREIEKVHSRRKYRNQNQPDPEDEWTPLPFDEEDEKLW